MKKIVALGIFILFVLSGCQEKREGNPLKEAISQIEKETIFFNELIPFEYDECFQVGLDLDENAISELINISYKKQSEKEELADVHLIFLKENQIINDYYCSLEEGNCISLKNVGHVSYNDGETIQLDRDSIGNYLLHEISYEELPEADFSNSVFLGNSKIEGLMNSGLILEADYICKVGWNVAKAFTETDEVSEELLIDKVNYREYNKVFLMFGDNELGWAYPEEFIEDYKKLIHEIQSRQSNASIYIMSIFPVSKKIDEKGKFGVTKENILIFNELLKKMCEEENLYYLDIYSVLADENGMLPDKASYDGVHPKNDELEKIVQYMKENAKL